MLRNGERATTLVTGGSGFIGSAVVARLQEQGSSVLGVTRGAVTAGIRARGPLLDACSDWRPWLDGCCAVVHTAGRVHVMRESSFDALRDYRATNVDGTLQLARQAAEAGVRRFVFLSSIKVNGEETLPGRPFSAGDVASPQDPYALSKAEAEAGLRALALETGMEVVIIRPPLVYGPGVKANFLTMMHRVRRGVPLPLGAVKHNRRSLVALDNLVDLIVTCIDHPAASNRTFLVSDGEDLSTRDLLERLAAAMGVPARLVPVPLWILEAGATLLGKRALIRRLCGNLQVDIASTCELLDWRPPIGVDEGVRRAVEGLEK